MKLLNFRLSARDRALVDRIIDRAIDTAIIAPGKESRLHFSMNLAACHLNGCPLDLDRMLAAPLDTLAHDIHGIDRYLSRETGELTRHFDPRCSAPTAEDVLV